MPVIEFKDVHKTYPFGETSVPALADINLAIERGEFVAIWGPSGSGKSTLCNLVGALDTPTAGTVLLDQREVSSLPDDELCRLRNHLIGFVFQGFNLMPVLSALENVLLPLEIGGESRPGARAKAAERLQALGLGAHMDHRPAKLSGGQQQRVAIARALITDPLIVIADEPTANLDSDTALQIIDVMRQLNRRDGTTFLFATHDDRLLRQVDRKILLRDGRIAEDARSS
jgi:putative ABC transport system ATP-binding protein